MKGLPADTVNIVLAHLLVDGARVGTGERELHLGQVYGVNPQQLPSAVQYIGLGHLHRPQEILAPAKTRYPGSLIELDFGEQEQDKSVVVLDAQPQRAARHRARSRSRRDEGCARSRARSTTCSASPRREATTTCASG